MFYCCAPLTQLKHTFALDASFVYLFSAAVSVVYPFVVCICSIDSSWRRSAGQVSDAAFEIFVCDTVSERARTGRRFLFWTESDEESSSVCVFMFRLVATPGCIASWFDEGIFKRTMN